MQDCKERGGKQMRKKKEGAMEAGNTENSNDKYDK
jgi:hypothetical protein